MTERKKRSGPMAVTEVMARLAKDPEYQARMRLRNEEIEARAKVLRAAAQPIVRDLRAAGYEVETVWDLGNRSVPYTDALPILMKHFLAGGYPDRVMESLGQALAVKPAIVFWDELKSVYLRTRNHGERTGAAVALSECVTKDRVEELIELLCDDEGGSWRVYFVEPVLRKGGQRGYEVVESLRSDPVVGKEVTERLRRRRKKPKP